MSVQERNRSDGWYSNVVTPITTCSIELIKSTCYGSTVLLKHELKAIMPLSFLVFPLNPIFPLTHYKFTTIIQVRI